jgi:hypothetical protein
MKAQTLKTAKLSDQALGAVMMALQRAILNQEDVTESLKNFEFVLTNDGLWVKNPPLVKYDYAETPEDEL